MNADKWTDSELIRLEARIAKEYEEAGKDLAEYYDNYINGWDEVVNGENVHHAGLYERKATEYQAYLNGAYKDPTGKYTDEQMFNRWWVAQEGRGQRYADMIAQMSDRLADAGKIAQDYSNGLLPRVWVNNNNAVANLATASAMEQGITGVRFDLVDEWTVRRLMEGSREVRPYKPIALDLPKMNKYNRTKLQNALLEGILAGDGIPKMTERFMQVANMNRASATRNARTAVTGAQSAGKQARYEDLDKKGCKATKIWVATEDDRTRPEHADADGQEVNYDEYFDVGGEELLYPADPSGSDWNIYNCRCTTRAGKFTFSSVLSDRAKQIDKIEVITSNDNSKEKLEQIYGKAVSGLNENRQNDIINQLKNADPEIEDVWKKCSDKMNEPKYDANGTAYYSKSDKCTHFVDEITMLGDNSDFKEAYDVYFHEYGHNIDHILGEISEKGKSLGASIMKEAYSNIANSVEYGEYYSRMALRQNGYGGIGMSSYVKEIIREKDPDGWKMLRSEFNNNKDDEGYLKGLYAKYMSKEECLKSFEGSKDGQDIVESFCDRLRNIYGLKERSDISDMYESTTIKIANKSYPLGIGHGSNYYRDINGKIDGYRTGLEGFAEMYSASARNGEALKVIKAHFPDSYELFKEKLRGVK